MGNANNAKMVFNAARQEAGEGYQNAVPQALDDTDFARAFAPIVKYQPFMNEFLNYVVNKIVFQTFESKVYENKFSILRGEGFPLGTDCETSYINPATSRQYSVTLGDTLLARKKPDVKTQYFRRNREDQYWITIPRELLTGAFTRWEQLDDTISGMIRSLYSGNQIDEQNLVKTMWVEAVNDNIIKQTPIAWSESDPAESTLNLLKECQRLSYKFEFPSSDFNNWMAYATAQGVTDATPAVTWVENSDVVIFISADALVECNYETLAGAFNLSKADFRQRIIPVDRFAYTDKTGATVANDNILAIVTDRKTFEYRDNMTVAGDFYNPAGLYRNHYLTVFQTYGVNVCSNCVALVKQA